METETFTYDDMMDIAGWMAAADCKRPIAELKEEAEMYIKTKKAAKEPTSEKQTGIELIAIERQEQIKKHDRTIEQDCDYNTLGQLSVAAGILSQKHIPDGFSLIPKGWDKKIWDKMLNKTYQERLIIAGALIAAEIDRLNSQS